MTLARRQSAVPTTPVDDHDPLDDIRPDELIMPVIKAVQGTSRSADIKHAGEFFDTIAETYSPLLTMAVLVIRRARSLFEKGIFDQPPLCSSDDAIKPAAPMVVANSVTGPTCAECPFSQWGSAGEGRKGQACQFSYSLIAWNLETDSPFLVRIHGISINPWRLYMSRIKASRKPLYAMATLVTLEAKTFDAGKAYVMRFTPGHALPPEQAKQMRNLIDGYRNIELPSEYAKEDNSESEGVSVFD